MRPSVMLASAGRMAGQGKVGAQMQNKQLRLPLSSLINGALYEGGLPATSHGSTGSHCKSFYEQRSPHPNAQSNMLHHAFLSMASAEPQQRSHGASQRLLRGGRSREVTPKHHSKINLHSGSGLRPRQRPGFDYHRQGRVTVEDQIPRRGVESPAQSIEDIYRQISVTETLTAEQQETPGQAAITEEVGIQDVDTICQDFMEPRRSALQERVKSQAAEVERLSSAAKAAAEDCSELARQMEETKERGCEAMKKMKRLQGQHSSISRILAVRGLKYERDLGALGAYKDAAVESGTADTKFPDAAVVCKESWVKGGVHYDQAQIIQASVLALELKLEAVENVLPEAEGSVAHFQAKAEEMNKRHGDLRSRLQKAEEEKARSEALLSEIYSDLETANTHFRRLRAAALWASETSPFLTVTKQNLPVLAFLRRQQISITVSSECDDNLLAIRSLDCDADELSVFPGVELRLRRAGFTAPELKGMGFGANHLKIAGFDAFSLQEAGFSTKQLHQVGYCPSEMELAGLDASRLKENGLDAKALFKANYQARTLKELGFRTAELRDAGFGDKCLRDAGLEAQALTRTGLLGVGSACAAVYARIVGAFSF